MCGLLLSTPTFLESPIVYYSSLIWTCEPSRHVLHVFPTAHLQPVPNGDGPLPSEMLPRLMGEEIIRLLNKNQVQTPRKGKTKTKYTGPHTCFIYIFIYFHVQSYIPNPRGSIIEINTEITTLLNELFAHRNEASASKRQQVGHSRTQFSDYRGQ